MPEIVAERPTESQHLSIDWSCPFAPERITPLAYVPLYSTLTPQERLRYNQLFALYLNEKTAYMEEELSHFIRQVSRLPRARHLKQNLLALLQDEERHAADFKTLNRLASPELYGETSRRFVRPGKLVSSLTHGMATFPTLFPLLLWIILLQEERSVYHSHLFVQERERLEPSFVAIHEHHSQDEAAHVSVDEALLEILWEGAPKPIRILNGHLLAGVFREFLYYPKRAAVEVVKIAFAAHPRLDEMVRQVLALKDNHDFLITIYNRTTNPKTLALMDRFPELSPVAEVMAGYRR